MEEGTIETPGSDEETEGFNGIRTVLVVIIVVMFLTLIYIIYLYISLYLRNNTATKRVRSALTGFGRSVRSNVRNRARTLGSRRQSTRYKISLLCLSNL